MGTIFCGTRVTSTMTPEVTTDWLVTFSFGEETISPFASCSSKPSDMRSFSRSALICERSRRTAMRAMRETTDCGPETMSAEGSVSYPAR